MPFPGLFSFTSKPGQQQFPSPFVSQQEDTNNASSGFVTTPRLLPASLTSSQQHPMTEIIPQRLYFTSLTVSPRQSDDVFYFTVDQEFVYVPFYADTGPLNIGNLVQFRHYMNARLKDPVLTNKTLIMYSSPQPDKRANAVLLICSYMILEHDMTPTEAFRPFEKQGPSLTTFRDAGYGPATYFISVYDCLAALHKGVKQFRFLDIDSMPLEESMFYERVENGDMNWIIPGLFLALATPHDEPPPALVRYHEQKQAIRPNEKSKFIPLLQLDELMTHFQNKNIKTMIRLNNKLYDRRRVVAYGIDHLEMYFPDGSIPPWDTIVRKFVAVADARLPVHLIPQTPYFDPSQFNANRDSNTGAIAVHCKAGLGRTGSLICVWMMKTFGWSARDCISWCRLMRPGSVVGPQQNWLESVEKMCWEWGEMDRRRHEAKVAFASSAISDNTVPNSDGMDLTRNEGTSDLATTAMGMSVPIQPYKKDRDFKTEVQTAVQQDVHQYNLRTRIQPAQTDYASIQVDTKAPGTPNTVAQRRTITRQ